MDVVMFRHQYSNKYQQFLESGLDESLVQRIINALVHPSILSKPNPLLELLQINRNEEAKLFIQLCNIENKTLHDSIDTSIKEKNVERLKYLKEMGVDFNNPIGIQTPLVLAAYCDLECFKYIYDNTINPNIRTPRGRTPMHAAVLGNQKDILKILLKDEKTKMQKDMSDVFGNTPYGLAVANKSTLVEEFTDNLHEDRQNINTVNTSQNNINKKLSDYLKLKAKKQPDQYIDLDINSIISPTGMCNGLEFLFAYYFYRTNSSDEYFNILNQILTWDGQESSLKRKVTGTLDTYVDLNDLFNQFINDLHWFQHDSKDIRLAMKYEVDDSSSKKQYNRFFQYELIKNHKNPVSCSKLFDFPVTSIDKCELKELLDYFTQFKDVYIDIGGSKHATALYISKTGTMNYYDPNDPNKLMPFDNTEDLANYIYAFKYQQLNQLTIDNKMRIEFQINAFSRGLNIAKLEKIETDLSFPFNKFNDAHIAILRNDTQALLRSVESNPELLRQKDIHGYTPLERAITMNANQAAIALLNKNNNLDYYHLADLAYIHNNLTFFEKLIECYEFDYQKLFSSDHFFKHENYLCNFYESVFKKINQIDIHNIAKPGDFYLGFGVDEEKKYAYPLRMAVVCNDDNLFKILIKLSGSIESIKQEEQLYKKAIGMLANMAAEEEEFLSTRKYQS